ncbi:NUDIX hydrolase [Prauserella muralis]|uniref:NUDIX hydrolase n=1 Tax=Prauserella muralis TaxID=588067 RepID=A0A2V4BBC7_9PSEU|nr:NUDIX domain-containing protein [Prauserella muralis]PXY32446.1 NUDIX hydrolase [Prauserella muralis]TWE23860.1 ADP-ribose pyrophosphatase YjhB (NUDIX family) [Prauserella muralis]
MRHVRCVGGVVHDATGRLLLIQRAHEPARGRWSLPGGRVEAGETDADAVVRELREETGLDVLPGQLVGTVVRGAYEIHDYACAVGGGELVAGDDAAAARWVDGAAFAELERTGALTDGLADTLRDWGALPRA